MAMSYAIGYYLFYLLVGLGIAFLVSYIPFKIKLLKGIAPQSEFEDTDDNAIMTLNTDLANSFLRRLNANTRIYEKLVKKQLFRIVMSFVVMRETFVTGSVIYFILYAKAAKVICAIISTLVLIVGITIMIISIVRFYNLLRRKEELVTNFKDSKEKLRELLYKYDITFYDSEIYDDVIFYNKKLISEATLLTANEKIIAGVICAALCIIVVFLILALGLAL